MDSIFNSLFNYGVRPVKNGMIYEMLTEGVWLYNKIYILKGIPDESNEILVKYTNLKKKQTNNGHLLINESF